MNENSVIALIVGLTFATSILSIVITIINSRDIQKIKRKINSLKSEIKEHENAVDDMFVHLSDAFKAHSDLGKKVMRLGNDMNTMHKRYLHIDAFLDKMGEDIDEEADGESDKDQERGLEKLRESIDKENGIAEHGNESRSVTTE